jgi:hypothetical protein
MSDPTFETLRDVSLLRHLQLTVLYEVQQDGAKNHTRFILSNTLP